MTGLEHKRIAVTGASGGIGQAVCQRLADEGAIAFALDLGEASLGEWIRADVTDAESMEAAARAITQRAGGVDGLVACAGIVEDDVAAEDMSVEEFERVLAVNLKGVFVACRTFGRLMLAQGAGRIVNVASMSGQIVNFPQRQCAYNASKAGVSALTRSLAVEWGPRGVRVNAISPGYVDTPLLALKTHQHELWKRDIVIERFAHTGEVASAIAFLLSDEAEYFQGSDLLMDGGFSLR